MRSGTRGHKDLVRPWRRLGRRLGRILTTATILSVTATTLTASLPAAAFTPSVGTAGCVLQPKLTDVTINQGLGSYNPYTRGKDALVKFYLSLPDCADTVHGDSITINGGTLAATGQTQLNGAVAPFTVNMMSQPGFQVGPAAGAPYVNQPADPVFLVSGAQLSPASDTSSFYVNFTGNITYTGTPGSGSSSTLSTGTATFSKNPAGSNLTATFERKTGALRVLLVEMVDPQTANTFNSSSSPNAHTAVDNGMLELARMYPLPNGVSSTLQTQSGGLRYQFNAGTINLRSVQSGGTTYNLISSSGKFCGASSDFDVLKPVLEAYRQAWNAQNSSTTPSLDYEADRVVGVVDEANSLGSAGGCPDGMANLPINGSAATQSFVRACYRTCLNNGASITGSLLGMEIAHTTGLVPSGRDNTFSPHHSPNWAADMVPTQTLNRTFNMTTRTVMNPRAHSVMDYAVDPGNSTNTWSEKDTLLEANDYGYLQCIFGGMLDQECSGAGTIGTLTGVSAGGLYTLSGSVTVDPASLLPSAGGTSVVDSYLSPNQSVQTPSVSSSLYRLLQCAGPCQMGTSSVLQNDGVPVSFNDDDHAGSGASPSSQTTVGALQIAFPINASATRFELRYISGSNNLLLYGRDGNNGAPQVVPSSLQVSGASPGQVTQYPTLSCPIRANGLSGPAGVVQGPDGAFWETDSNCGAIERVVPGGTDQRYSLADNTSGPVAITNGPDGNLWFSEYNGAAVGRITTSGAITEFPVGGGHGRNLTVGPDGKIWFTTSLKVGRMDPATGAFTLFSPPSVNPASTQDEVGSIATGSDGNLWFTEGPANKVANINPNTLAFTEYGVPSAGADPLGIAPGATGDLWITEYNIGRVARVTTAGAVTEYPLPSGAGAHAGGMSAGPDGKVWFVVSFLGNNPYNHVASVSPSGAVTEYALPNAGVYPFHITPGFDGSMWVTENLTNTLDRVTTGSSFSELGLGAPSGNPANMATAADGNVWVTEFSNGKVARVTPAGAVTEFPLGANVQPQGIAKGPDGNVWVVERSGNRIDRLSTAGVLLAQYPVPTSGSLPAWITTGPDGNLWVTEEGGNKIAQVTVAGVVTEYALPNPNSQPAEIITGSDGALWFTEQSSGNRIGRITTSGVVTEYQVSAGAANIELSGITLGPDGNIWFTEEMAQKVGYITPAGAITEYATPAGGNPINIVSAPDGNLYTTLPGTNQLARVTTTGVVTTFALPTFNAAPDGMAIGPDNNVWFAEYGANKVGRYTLGSASGSTQTASFTGTTASGNGAANLHADVFYQCPGTGSVAQPVAVGITGQQSGSQVSFSATYSTAGMCGGSGTVFAVVNDGYRRSAPSSTASNLPASSPQVAANSPTANQVFLQYAGIPLHGVIGDAQDGPLSGTWTMTDGSGNPVAGAGARDGDGKSLGTQPWAGPTVDLAPPSGGWNPGTYTVTYSGTNSYGLRASASVAISIVADRNHNGIADSVEAQSCFPPSAGSDPYAAWQDYDADGIPNIDDPAPCTPATNYNALEVFQPDHLNVYSKGQPATVDITLNYNTIASVLPSSVQINAIQGAPVSGFTAVHWSVINTSQAVAQFDRQALENYLIANHLVNKLVSFEIGGKSATWSFDGGCSTNVSA